MYFIVELKTEIKGLLWSQFPGWPTGMNLYYVLNQFLSCRMALFACFQFLRWFMKSISDRDVLAVGILLTIIFPSILYSCIFYAKTLHRIHQLVLDVRKCLQQHNCFQRALNNLVIINLKILYNTYFRCTHRSSLTTFIRGE